MPTNSLTANNLASGSAFLFTPSFNPPVVLSDYVLDNGLITFHTLCDRIYVCTGPITDFSSVIATALGFNNFGTGNAFGGINNSVTNGRTVTSISFSNGSITTSGMAICWAAVDFADSHLLAWGVLAGDVQVNSGQLFGLPAFTIHEPSLFSGFGIQIPMTSTSLIAGAASLGSPLVSSPNLSASNLSARAAALGTPAMVVGQNFIAFDFIPNHADALGIPSMSVARSFTITNLSAGAAGFSNSKPALSINGVGGGVPVVTGTTASISIPITNGENVGSPISATNSPTSWAITSNPGNYFAITSGGQIFASTYFFNTTSDIPPGSYALTVKATNASGSGSATVTVTITTSGTIFYVSTTGSDSANGTSTSTPFLTIQKGINSATAAGSACLIMAGTYTVNSALTQSASGTAAHPIFIGPYNNGVINVNLNVSSGGYIQLNGSFVTLMGLICNCSGSTSTSPALASWQGNSQRMINLTFHDCHGGGIWVGGASNGNITMGCTVYNYCLNNVNNALGSGGGWGEGISCEGDTASNVVNHQFLGNTCHDGWGEGFGMAGCVGCTHAYGTVFNTFSVLMYADESQNASFHHNFAYKSVTTYDVNRVCDGMRIAREVAGPPSSGILVYNNLIVGNMLCGISYLNYDSGGGIQNCKIMNNTVVNPNQCFQIVANSATTGNILENNIFYGGSNASGSASGITCSHNCWFNTTGGTFAGTGDVDSNPGFTGTVGAFVAANYQVTSGSPMKNAGANLFSSGVTNDYGENARPSSGNFTIGAWQ